MNVVIGLFTRENLAAAIEQLTASGISRSDLSTVATEANVPDYIEGEPEKAAAWGAELGAVTGGAMSALGSIVLSVIPGMEATLVSGLLATAAGSAVGAFMGGLYNTRAETNEGMAIDEALADGEVLLLVQITADKSESVAALMAATGGHDIETHELPDDDDN